MNWTLAVKKNSGNKVFIAPVLTMTRIYRLLHTYVDLLFIFVDIYRESLIYKGTTQLPHMYSVHTVKVLTPIIPAVTELCPFIAIIFNIYMYLSLLENVLINFILKIFWIREVFWAFIHVHRWCIGLHIVCSLFWSTLGNLHT